nr:hypothetical protein [Anaerolineaceae bacterium]
LLDLDKTAIGARGRNDKVIDLVRLEAAFSTAEHYLDKGFDQICFKRTYDYFNQSKFHTFTTDNQDYLVYLCLLVESGYIESSVLSEQIFQNQNTSFVEFVSRLQIEVNSFPMGIQEMNHLFYKEFQRGNPTPFKAFRAFEYQNTLGRMGCLNDDVPINQMLQEEIVMTHEVQQAVLHWKKEGAIILGMSDKPDEASKPDKQQAKAGLLPIHRVKTHVIGA